MKGSSPVSGSGSASRRKSTKGKAAAAAGETEEEEAEETSLAASAASLPKCFAEISRMAVRTQRASSIETILSQKTRSHSWAQSAAR